MKWLKPLIIIVIIIIIIITAGLLILLKINHKDETYEKTYAIDIVRSKTY